LKSEQQTLTVLIKFQVIMFKNFYSD